MASNTSMNKAYSPEFDRIRMRILEAARQELANGECTAEQLLAILAHVVGQMLAMQDARHSVESYMQLIWENLREGNQNMLEMLNAPQGNC